MADKTLTMSFLNELGKRTSLRVDGIKDNLSQQEVVNLMDTIISKNIFKTSGGDLKIKDGAQIQERNVSKIEVR